MKGIISRPIEEKMEGKEEEKRKQRVDVGEGKKSILVVKYLIAW